MRNKEPHICKLTAVVQLCRKAEVQGTYTCYFLKILLLIMCVCGGGVEAGESVSAGALRGQRPRSSGAGVTVVVVSY